MAYEVPPGARFAYASSLRSLDEQLRRIEALDTKAGILLAADGVLAGFLFTRGSTLLEAPEWIGILAAVAVLVSMTLALLGFATRNYATPPEQRRSRDARRRRKLGSSGVLFQMSFEPSTRTL